MFLCCLMLIIYLFLVIEVPTISPILQDPVNPLLSEVLVFYCTVGGRPLVNVTWDVGPAPLLSTSQYPADFIGPAVSDIQINSSLLSGTVPISCYGNDSVNATAIINAYSKLKLFNVNRYIVHLSLSLS